MSEAKLMVLYPQPKDVIQFEQDYQAHLDMFHEKMNIPKDQGNYTVTKMVSTPKAPSAYYQMFTYTFESAEALKQTLASEEMQAVAADANRISTGGAPVILIGSDD